MESRSDCGCLPALCLEIPKCHAKIIRQPSQRLPPAIAFLVLIASLIFPSLSRAQVSYVAQFKIEKQKYIVGEPIFCTFVIQNTGSQTFSFRYRSPDRVQTRGLEGEPQFRVTGASQRPLPDPAPHPCGGEKGSVVYGSVRLAPGKIHSERWLLNQWARFSKPGHYDAKAERRLPLYTTEPGTAEF